MYNKIKSIEIFPNNSIDELPQDVLELVEKYINPNNVTIRIYDSLEVMEKIFDLCCKYDIRCHTYIC